LDNTVNFHNGGVLGTTLRQHHKSKWLEPIIGYFPRHTLDAIMLIHGLNGPGHGSGGWVEENIIRDSPYG